MSKVPPTDAARSEWRHRTLQLVALVLFVGVLALVCGPASPPPVAEMTPTVIVSVSPVPASPVVATPTAQVVPTINHVWTATPSPTRTPYPTATDTPTPTTTPTPEPTATRALPAELPRAGGGRQP